MKLILNIAALMLMGFSASARSPVCTMKYTNDASFISQALELESVRNSSEITKMTWKRLSSTEGEVKLSLDGSPQQTIIVGQRCSGGLTAHFVETPDQTPSPKDYVCKEWVNCMPTIIDDIGEPSGEKPLNYCSDDYFEWAEDNCDVQPKKAY